MITLDKGRIGGFIAENRKRQGLTQRELAQKLHVTDKAVSKWERGLSYPDVTLLRPLAAAFGIPVDALLTCRGGESEEHLTDTTPSLRGDTPEADAVQAVLDISRENDTCRRKRQRWTTIGAAAAVLVIALLAAWQHNGHLLAQRHTVSPDGAVALAVYRDGLIGGRYCVQAEQPLYMESYRCGYCGRSGGQSATRLMLDSGLRAVDGIQWSADGRYMLLSGRTGSVPAAWLELWDFAPEGKGSPVRRTDISTGILLQLSGHGSDTPTAPLLPALPGVSERTYLPRVALSGAQWSASGDQLELSYAYDGTDGVRRSGTLVYDTHSGSVCSIAGT